MSVTAASFGAGAATVGGGFVSAGWRHRHRPFATDGSSLLTWGDALRRVRHLALGLRRAVPDDTAIVLGGADGLDVRLLLMAAACAGVVVELRADRSHGAPAGAPVSVAGGPCIDAAACEVDGRDIDAGSPHAFEALLGGIHQDHDTVVLDGATLSHANLVWAARGVCQRLRLRHDDVVACHSPLGGSVAHVVGHVAAVLAGATLRTGDGGGPAQGVGPSTLVVGGPDIGRWCPPAPRSVRCDRGEGGRRPAMVAVGADAADVTVPPGWVGWVAVGAPAVAGPVAMGEAVRGRGCGRPMAGAALAVTDGDEVLVRTAAAVVGDEVWVPTGHRGRIDGLGHLEVYAPGAAGATGWPR